MWLYVWYLKDEGEWDVAPRDGAKDSLTVRTSSWGRGTIQGGRGGIWERQRLGQRHTVFHTLGDSTLWIRTTS